MFKVSDETFWHHPLIAIPLRRAFVPTLFAPRGKQPVQAPMRWRRRAEPDGGALASANELSRAPSDLRDEGGPFRPPPGVVRVSDRGFAQLWRIGPG